MDWIIQAATWIRDWLAQQAWLDGWRTTIEATPDWALVGPGPGLVLLVAILVFMQVLRGRRGARRPDKDDVQSASAKSRSKPQSHAPTVSAMPTERRADPSPAGESEQPAPGVRRASGVPDANEQERKARVFLSSTFRDMRAERKVLATETFPSIKRAFRARGVEVQEVDLRWGVNEGDATLDVCLQAVRRSNWFVGLIGQRYGTTLDDELTVAQLGPDYRAVADGLGRSLTEIEILEGVLLNERSNKEILFFERDPAWLDTLSPGERPEYEDQHPEARAKLDDLKVRIRARVGAMHAYASPAEIGGVFTQTMRAALERAFPPIEDTVDPFMQEHRLHAAYARERLGLYVGGEDYIGALNAGVEEGSAPQLVVGESGGGKSALIANWVQQWRDAHPGDVIFAHYLGASPESAAPAALVRRLLRHLDAVTGEEGTPPNIDATLDELRDALLDRMGRAHVFAEREDCRIVIALDGLDKLADEHLDLRWWPRTLAPRISLVASSLDGKAREAGRAREWSERPVKPFDAARQGLFIAETLKGWDKRDFPDARKQRVLAHAMAGLPLFLKTILEELRVSAANDVLDARLDHYLNASTMPDLYARILTQIEQECGKDFVAQALSLIWASRAGLEEDEIIAMVSATQNMGLGSAGLAWERLRNRLADNLRDAQGRVAFSHDYLRQAVEQMHLTSEDARQRAHLAIADRFDARKSDKRQAEELPYQLRAAQAWERLQALLIDLDRFKLLRARGDTELLRYWLPLKERDRDPEALLCAAFESRAGEPERWPRAEIDFAFTLEAFLSFAGATGESFQYLGQMHTAACERILGPEHPDTLISMGNFAQTLSARGDLQGAQRYQERVLEAEKRILGPEHPSTLISMGNLAGTLSARGDLEGAQRYQERVLEAQMHILGLENPSTLASMGNLAGTLSARGDLEGAQRYQQRVLEAQMRILGPEHPSTLTSMGNLAGTLGARGDLEGAQRYQERVLEAQMRILGPEHPSALRSMGNLAGTLGDRGDLEGAQRYQERILETMARILGSEHPSTLISMNNLAVTLRDSGDLEGAQSYQEQVLETMTRILGPEHPDTLTSMKNLAVTLRARSDPDGAKRYVERVLEAEMRILGPEHPDKLTSMNNLAQTLSDCGDLEGAQRYEERVLETMTRILGSEHLHTLTSMGNLAATLSARGDLEGAQKLFKRVLEATTRLLGPEHPDTLASMSFLAATLRARGDLKASQKLLERVLETQTRILGPAHLDTLISMETLAETLYARGDLEGALGRFEHVFAMAIRQFGAKDLLSEKASSWVTGIRKELQERRKN